MNESYNRCLLIELHKKCLYTSHADENAKLAAFIRWIV